MSLVESETEGESVRAPDILAELTGEPRERFESDAETPSLDELEMVDPDADTEADTGSGEETDEPADPDELPDAFTTEPADTEGDDD